MLWILNEIMYLTQNGIYLAGPAVFKVAWIKGALRFLGN